MISADDYGPIVENALREDLGDAGDITSLATVSADTHAVADLVARRPGVVAGLDVAAHAFRTVDTDTRFDALSADGDACAAGQVLATVSGPARSILTAERTALNLMGRMSGVATATRAYVDAVSGTQARISDTRKTMPGLRVLDKYAVTVGGGVNHRMGLYDAVMIKDNHLISGAGILEAVGLVRAAVGPDVEVTVEVENLAQVEEVLATSANRVLLDNMEPALLSEAVTLVGGRLMTEASGGITLENVAEVAATGVDVISIGAITHSAPQLDIALDFRPSPNSRSF